MKTVSFVFQDSKLLKASILENVRMAKPEASREEVVKVLEAAQCGDIISKLPEGIDTVIGTKGVYLSGGEQQRISANVQTERMNEILDHPVQSGVTALTNQGYDIVFDHVGFAYNRVLIIAHRMRTVAGADKIVVIKDGAVAQQGEPEVLMEKGGLYKEMAELQDKAQNWSLSGS